MLLATGIRATLREVILSDDSSPAVHAEDEEEFFVLPVQEGDQRICLIEFR